MVPVAAVRAAKMVAVERAVAVATWKGLAVAAVQVVVAVANIISV